MARTRRGLALGMVLLGAMGLGACGDDAATPVAGDAAPADCDADPGETVTVEIGDFLFDPTPVEVGVCDAVVWTNAHDQAHTSTGDGDVTWNTGNIAPGATSEPVLFDEPGRHTYICALHPFMEGEVTAA